MLVIYLAVVLMVVMGGISAWITAARMRKKLKSKLGRKIADSDLTSMTTWMQAAEAEESKDIKNPQV